MSKNNIYLSFVILRISLHPDFEIDDKAYLPQKGAYGMFEEIEK